jgi:hypothetical protein
MAVYRFRVSFEEFDDTFRDIDVQSTQTFAKLHQAIQQSIGFDGSKPASFFMSNDLWKKGQEITEDKNTGKAGKEAVLMSESRLCDFIADPHQKIYYMFDMPSQWNFFIELIKITADDPSKTYPVAVKSHGEAPKQYALIEPPKGVVDPEFMEEELLLDVEEATDEEGLAVESEEETEDGEVAGFGEAVDEEEYDNIEDRSEGGNEREEF